MNHSPDEADPTDRPPYGASPSTQLGDPDAAVGEMHIVMIPLDRLRPCTLPGIRRNRPPEEVSRLGRSIQAVDLGHPLLVRPASDGLYEVVDGDIRRFGLVEIGCAEAPCIVRVLDDREAVIVATHLNGARTRRALPRAWEVAEVLELTGLRPCDYAKIGGYKAPEISTSVKIARGFPMEAVAEFAERQDIPLARIEKLPRDFLSPLCELETLEERLEALRVQISKSGAGEGSTHHTVPERLAMMEETLTSIMERTSEVGAIAEVGLRAVSEQLAALDEKLAAVAALVDSEGAAERSVERARRVNSAVWMDLDAVRERSWASVLHLGGQTMFQLLAARAQRSRKFSA